MTRVTIRSIISPVKDQVSCDLSGEAVILSLKNGIYYTLNPLGARVWSLIRKPIRVEEIRDALLGEYNVDACRCEEDLLALVTDLEREGLVTVENGNIQ